MKIILGLLILFFIIWTILMVRGSFFNVDDKIYKAIKFSDTKTLILKIITTFASTRFFILLSILLVIFMNDKKMAILIVVFLAINGIINETLKRIIRRERPNIKRLVVEKGYSYPSGHTMSATCFYSFIGFLVMLSSITFTFKLVLGIFLLFIVIMIGFSRIYLGVHYFSDVVGGFLIGLSYSILYVQLVPHLLNMF